MTNFTGNNGNNTADALNPLSFSGFSGGSYIQLSDAIGDRISGGNGSDALYGRGGDDVMYAYRQSTAPRPHPPERLSP